MTIKDSNDNNSTSHHGEGTAIAEQYQVALFPIPSLVAFPGTIVPLHVFEPRYRQLVKESLDTERMIGVCHTTKTIRDAPLNQSATEILNSNQATYQPQEIFSAGFCELIETTPDGRLLAEIRIQKRLAIQDEIQTLPYRIVNCQEVIDEPDNHQKQNVILQQQIVDTLYPTIAEQDKTIADRLKKFEGNSAEFSFQVFQYLRFDPDRMQQILESTSAFERLTLIWETISQY